MAGGNESESAKKVWMEFNKAFVKEVAKKNPEPGKPGSFWVITVPKDTIIKGADAGGLEFTQSIVSPSKYREGNMAVSFPSESWEIKLEKRVRDGNGGYKKEGCIVTAGELKAALDESRNRWESAHGKTQSKAKEHPEEQAKAPVRHEGPKTIEEILEKRFPKAEFADREEERLEECIAMLAGGSMIEMWETTTAARIMCLPEYANDNSIRAQVKDPNALPALQNVLICRLLDSVTPEEAVLCARCVDMIDEISILKEAQYTVAKNAWLANSIDKTIESKAFRDVNVARARDAAQKTRLSLVPVTSDMVAKWAGIDLAAKVAPETKQPVQAQEMVRAAG